MDDYLSHSVSKAFLALLDVFSCFLANLRWKNILTLCLQYIVLSLSGCKELNASFNIWLKLLNALERVSEALTIKAK